MSTRMKSMQKPPLAKSPIRARPPRLPQPNSMQLQTPPRSVTKSLKPNRPDLDELEIRPEYRTISSELRALAKRVLDELGDDERDGLNAGFCASANTSSLFERGRYYEEYSARRNERLKRKKGQKGEEGKTAYNLGVTVESAKRGTSKKIGSLRKSISAAVSVERSSEAPRYMLRSMSKENKKPPLPAYSDRSVTRRIKKSQF